MQFVWLLSLPIRAQIEVGLGDILAHCARDPCPFIYHSNHHPFEVKVQDKPVSTDFDIKAVFKFPLLSVEKCDQIILAAERHAMTTGGGWSSARHKQRHTTYQTTDIQVHEDETPELSDIILPFVQTLKANVLQLYHRDLDWDELFVVKYDMAGQTSLDMHADASVVTFQVALNRAEEYYGGGTFFEEEEVISRAHSYPHSPYTMHCHFTLPLYTITSAQQRLPSGSALPSAARSAMRG
jgi:hypothetical protein